MWKHNKPALISILWLSAQTKILLLLLLDSLGGMGKVPIVSEQSRDSPAKFSSGLFQFLQMHECATFKPLSILERWCPFCHVQGWKTEYLFREPQRGSRLFRSFPNKVMDVFFLFLIKSHAGKMFSHSISLYQSCINHWHVALVLCILMTPLSITTM